MGGFRCTLAIQIFLYFCSFRICIMQRDNLLRNTVKLIAPEPSLAGDHINQAIESFNAISLTEMDRVKLMDRFDKKFVFSAERLPAILSKASAKYRILQIDSDRVFTYNSLYYDTLGYTMYHDHHNQKLNRFKVRRREYVNSGQVYLEIKFKCNKGRTRKKRIETANRNMAFCKDEKKFIKKITPYRAKMLHPAMHNHFNRITLVHKSNPERVTIDLNLSFEQAARKKELPLLVIAEIKQSKSSGFSDLEKVFRENHILPMNFSKYCMGLVMTGSGVKYNRFKQKIIHLNKICNDNGNASFHY